MTAGSDDHRRALDPLPPEQRAQIPALALAPGWDDRMWDDLWERTFTQIDRHRLATATIRRRIPHDALGRRVVPELARRWRSTALRFVFWWGLFAVFWFATGFDVTRRFGTSMPTACAFFGGLGVVVVLAALALRWWVRDLAGPPPPRRRWWRRDSADVRRSRSIVPSYPPPLVTGGREGDRVEDPGERDRS